MAKLHRICDSHINSSFSWNELRNILNKASHENKGILVFEPVLRRIISSPNMKTCQFDFRNTLISFLSRNLGEHEKKISILVEFYRIEDLRVEEGNFLREYEMIFDRIKSLCSEKVGRKSTNMRRIWVNKNQLIWYIIYLYIFPSTQKSNPHQKMHKKYIYLCS